LARGYIPGDSTGDKPQDVFDGSVEVVGVGAQPASGANLQARAEDYAQLLKAKILDHSTMTVSGHQALVTDVSSGPGHTLIGRAVFLTVSGQDFTFDIFNLATRSLSLLARTLDEMLKTVRFTS
jgi:hypothetical protein